MRVVADTDILSTFARIHRLDILKELFDEVIIPQAVKFELSKGKIDIKPLNPTMVKLAKEEIKALKQVDVGLGKGEKECFIIAKNRDIPLASNDKMLGSLCRREGLGHFTLARVLRLAILDKVIRREEGKQLVKLIEEEETTIIKNKDEIFK